MTKTVLISMPLEDLQLIIIGAVQEGIKKSASLRVKDKAPAPKTKCKEQSKERKEAVHA